MYQDMCNEYSIQEVFKLIIEGWEVIEKVEGKDLILFIGKSQVGKSTTINSLLGVVFEYFENRVVACPPESIIAPIGDVKEGGVSCTIIPKVYFSENSNICYLDTQGFFDTRKNKIIVVASKIIMQMAIKQAKSVRVVVLCSYHDIEAGIAEFDRLGEELSYFFKSENVPVYFLINRFYLSEPQSQNLFRMSEEKQLEQIKKCIEEHIKYIIKAGEKLEKDTRKRIEKKLRSKIKKKCPNEKIDQDEYDALSINELIQILLKKDPEFQRIINEILYIKLLKNNFEKGYYGYIKPTSQNSVQQFLREIDKLPAIDTSYLVFNEGNSERSYFDNIFHSKICIDICLMKKIQFSKLYPEDQIDQLIQQLNTSLEQNQRKKMQIENNTIDEKLLNELLNEFSKEISNNIQQIKNDIEKLEQIKKIDEQKKQDFENQEPIQVFKGKFYSSAWFLWYANHRTVYDKNILFCMFTEELDEHTVRDQEKSNINENEAKFDVVYTTKKAFTILLIFQL